MPRHSRVSHDGPEREDAVRPLDRADEDRAEEGRAEEGRAEEDRDETAREDEERDVARAGALEVERLLARERVCTRGEAGAMPAGYR